MSNKEYYNQPQYPIPAGAPPQEPYNQGYGQPPPNVSGYDPNQSKPYAQQYQQPQTVQGEKAPPDYERFKPHRRIHDIPFLVLFWATFIGFVVISAIALHSWIQEGGLGGGIGGDATGDSITLNSHTAYLLLLATGVAFFFSVVYLMLLRTFTSVIMKVTLVLSIVLNIALAVYMWITKYYSGAIIYTIIAVISILCFWGFWSRIPLATLLLQIVIDVANHHKSVYVVAVVGLFVQAAFSVWYVFTVTATYAKWTPGNPTCNDLGGSTNGVITGATRCSSTTVAGLVFFETFAYLWTSQVIANICLATVAGGPFGAWYYFGPRQDGLMPPHPTRSSFGRASTLSLGSIAFGSLIVTILELIRLLLNAVQNNNSNDPVSAILACCAACLVGFIENMVQFFNRYAYIEIALYGKPYIAAAKDTWRLFQDRGIDALVNDSLVGITLNFGGYIVAVLSAAFAYIYLRTTAPSYNGDGQYTAPVILFAFLVGFMCMATLASTIEAGVSTIFVGLGEDPQILAERSPPLFARVGILDSKDLVPTVGGREDGEAGITTPLELYGKAGNKVYAIQQRSPVMKSHKSEFILSLLSFIENSRLSTVIILSGMDLSNRPDAHMLATTYHVLPNAAAGTPLSSVLEELKTHTLPLSTSTAASEIPSIPGSGLTRRLVSLLPLSFPPTGLIIEYVLEGDNRADARILAGAAAKCLQKELGTSGQGAFMTAPILALFAEKGADWMLRVDLK
ncbi:putative choline transporter, neither null mutation nor overexpression affects choline transport [Tulasnella sp. 331]|nr:putative choline transporter, neither null mutation nor overexpression affects choline transport [Tulasnella sp. 331]